MKNLSFILILILCSCAGTDKWTKADKTLLTINGVMMTVDMLQTQDIYRRSEYYEINPVIDAGVKQFGTGFIPFYFIGSFGLRYLIADSLPSTYRKVFLSGTALVSTFLVINNDSIGLKVRF